MKHELSGDEQLEYSVIAYPTLTWGAKYNACVGWPLPALLPAVLVFRHLLDQFFDQARHHRAERVSMQTVDA